MSVDVSEVVQSITVEETTQRITIHLGTVGAAGTTNHLALSNIGTNTHAQIDTALTRLANTSGTNTGDMSDAAVKTAYENNADTNAYTDSEKTNLGNQSGTNTGDQTSVSGNSGSTDALKSATTAVDVVSATAPTTGQVLTATGASAATWQTPSAAGGDVVGPASSTDNAIAVWDGVGGDTVKDSTVLVDSVGRISQPSLNQSTYLGESAGIGDDLTTNNNTGVGFECLKEVVSGTSITALGYRAGHKYTGNTSVFIGDRAGGELAFSGAQTVYIGAQAGRRASSTGGKQCVLIGSNVASTATYNGNNNIFIGFNVASGQTTGSSCLMIGNNIQPPGPTTSNYLSIGNVIYGDTSSGNVGIGTTDYGSGTGGVIGIVDATAPSGTPTGGGVLYVESGALKYKGSSGTITTLGAA